MDVGGLAITIAFVMAGLSLIPLDKWLTRREATRRREQQAQRRRYRW
jgi:hypothetical protein